MAMGRGGKGRGGGTGGVAPGIEPAGSHGGRRALLESRASLLAKLISRKPESSIEPRIRLAQLNIDLEKWNHAKLDLEACLKLDAADALGARRLLLPLLLHLGEHREAQELLHAWSSDSSIVMLFGRLLCALALWDGEDENEATCHAAFDAAAAANWYAVALLAAVSGGESPISEETIVELREQRHETLKRTGSCAEWPGPGGVQEAMLVSEQYAGFAGVGTLEAREEEAWPGLDGTEVWICRRLLDSVPSGQPSAAPTDSKKHICLFDEKLEEIIAEVQHIVLEAESKVQEGEDIEVDVVGPKEEEEAGMADV